MEKTCFVVMGFGKKTDFETGRTLDLDMSYQNMIKPAVEEAGLKCIRADEIVHSGQIDVPMYEQLLKADVVVADLSTSNKNAFYELGVRHALRPYTTVVICEDGMKSLPFDANHIAVRKYHHLGEDIGSSEARRFSRLLSQAIKEISSKNPPDNDSPVYTFINNLKAPEIAAIIMDAVTEGKAAGLPGEKSTLENESETHSALMKEVDKAQKSGDWLTAKVLLTTIRSRQKMSGDEFEDPDTMQRLALATYKAKIPGEKEALTEATTMLTPLEPAISNDPETLGLWGAIHKRLWEIDKNRDDLDKAIRAYERGFYIRNDYYNGINFAYLLNVRSANNEDPAESIADYVRAEQVRREVVKICNEWLTKHPPPPGAEEKGDPAQKYWETWYWVQATLAEAYTGTKEIEKAATTLDSAFSRANAEWMKASTLSQINKLKTLLENSPLKYIRDQKEFAKN